MWTSLSLHRSQCLSMQEWINEQTYLAQVQVASWSEASLWGYYTFFVGKSKKLSEKKGWPDHIYGS